MSHQKLTGDFPTAALMKYDAACHANPLPDTADKASAAASSTYDAALYALQHNGEAALARQAKRLSEFSIQQLESLIASLSRLGADERLLLSLSELLP